MKKYSVIYADPPWSFNSKKTGGSMKSGAASQYPTMSSEDLKNLDVESISNDSSLLVMWYVGSQSQEALDLCRAWGFRCVNINGFVWRKLTKHGKDHFGMGSITRAGSESALVGIKGRTGGIIKDRGVRSVISAKTGKHSQKPHDFRQAIEKLCGETSRLEMFAREKFDGWDVFGNEVEGSIKIGNKK